jgi:hypothetical protein
MVQQAGQQDQITVRRISSHARATAASSIISAHSVAPHAPYAAQLNNGLV